MKEKIFIENGILKSNIYTYLSKELKDVNFEDIEIQHLPTTTRVVIYTTQPGIIIGPGGENIERLTNEIKEKFKIENPQIDVQRIDQNVVAPQIIARNIAKGIENKKNYRILAEYYLDRIMRDKNVLGAEIILSGKISGARKRKDKFYRGYMKKSGEFAEKYVKRGYRTAQPKLGSIGVKVNIFMKPEGFKEEKESKN
ncbi:MAG: 30S ribosomal protein S3 [Candidatus Aenigmarchaeota archaeon ex4484_56]|nr:MAG: 30S ribosomal protein S3 [Candidatus Aenigmarchaeota archaeon ex4484_56]